MGLWTRAIRPPNEGVTPNPNDPANNPPASVGPPSAVPGDPDGVTFVGDVNPASSLPRLVPSAWSGWPADWWPPLWHGSSHLECLADIAWACIDKNASALSTMPPYLVGAAPTLDADWLNNPDPNVYTSWEEMAKSLFWDFQAVGEAFVLATARYATGWPARFHVVPPWTVNVEMDAGRRVYTIGSLDVTSDMLHLRYTSSVDDAHGHGPLEAGRARLVAAEVLTRYGTNLASNGGLPTSVLEHPDELTADQAADLRAQWVTARVSAIGEPAVLSGGVQWRPVQLNPTEMALVDLLQFNEARIAVLLGVPPHMVGLSSGPDSMTYKNVESIYDYHWRDGLRPKAQTVMAGLSGWLLPRGTSVELNRDAYIQPGPLERAQVAQILNAIVSPAGTPALSVDEIRDRERLNNSTPEPLSEGVLR